MSKFKHYPKDHKFRIGDIINVISFGEPNTEKVVEWSKEHEKFRCQFDGGNAPGSCWRTTGEILEAQDRVNEYYINKQRQINRGPRKGDNNGPTGHGDICFSDADPGL